ncbi:MAG: HDIG domain-containing protein [Actinomycetota bacterium]|nr:HDIG domain-containing protein [Actinomycetota bacterium]
MASLLDRLMRLAPTRGPLRSALAQRVALGFAVIAIASGPLVVQTPPVGLTEGAPAPRTFRANRTVQFIDEIATRDARDEAAASVKPVTVFDATALTNARGEIRGFYDDVVGAKAQHGQSTTATIAALHGELAAYEQAWIETAVGLDEVTLQQVRVSSEQLVTTVLSRRFTADEIESAIAQMRESADSMPYDAAVRKMIAGVIEQSIRPTVAVDPAATVAAREAAADGLDAVVIVKQAGENIVQRGEIVSAEQIEIVRRLGLLEQGGSFGSLAALVTLFASMVAVAGTFVWRYDPGVWERFRDLVIISVLLVGMVWITRGMLWIVPELSVYVFPIPLAAMLATLLIGPREGMLVAIITSLSAVLLGFSGGSAVVSMLVWSLSAVVAMAFMTDRRRLFYVGSYLVGSGMAIGFIASLAGGVQLQEALTAAGWASLGGMISAVLGYGLLPFFEHIFGVTTDIRLLELGSPGHPLMRELMTKAPGTYSHSVMTGNLAEAAAEAISANPLLARVGAYYHDIGKSRRPGFFVENQAGSENPHDSTAPNLSALIITAHVREGLELAEQHGLPREIVDIIRQHHGTSLVSYFYSKAAEGEGPVYEADFRYDGERPQSREAALVMLADSSEAAVRAVRKPTLPRIEATVRKIVDGKVADGQLVDAQLTLADIERIVKVYSRMLASMYHPRIEYPDATPRKAQHANPHHEPSRP